MYQQLGPQDAQFLYAQTPTNLTHVMGVTVYDPATAPGGKVGLRDIIAHINSRLHISPVFRQKLYRPPFNIDHPYWVPDEHFDLEAHITHSRLPEPGDWRTFAAAVSRHFSRPMDMNRPLWDLHVLEGLDTVEGFAANSYAVMIRLHHAAVDGIAASRLMAALCDRDVRGTPVIELGDPVTELGRRPVSGDLLKRAARSTISSPLKMTSSLLKVAPEIFGAAKTGIGNRKKEKKPGAVVPETRFNGSVSPHKVFEALNYRLDEFKQIRTLVDGATINDVALAIVGGALRSYLQKHGELPVTSLIGWCPVNARKGDAKEQESGNSLSAMTLPIGTDIDDPLQRLVQVRKLTAASKAAESGMGARMVTELIQHIPSATVAVLARIMSNERFTPRFCNLFVSNVPGSPTPQYMAGAKCTHQYGLAPLGNGMGLFVAVGSYNGSMIFNIISDKNILPDIDFFASCIDRSFKDYRRLIPKARRGEG